MKFLASLTVTAFSATKVLNDLCKPSVTVDTGTLIGTKTLLPNSVVTVNKFLGIPFGIIPQRFSPPEPAKPWEGTYNASNYQPACLQQFSYPEEARNLTIALFNTPPPPAGEDEDCLNLNVYAPATAGKKPVLFWLFGGAFKFGANSLWMYDGSRFAADQDVVVVTVNYRTNIFGFPGYPGQPKKEQNLGLLDQRLALDWARRNIAVFGGDPDKITIFGESAGAASVDMLVTYPPKPLPFRGAIMQSGQQSFIGQNNDSRTSWNILAKSLNSTPEDAFDIIRNMKATELKDTIERLMLVFNPVNGDGVTSSATPRGDRKKSTKSSSRIARVPVLIGSNADEGSIYAIGQNATVEAYMRDFVIQCPIKYIAEETAAVGIPTWRYYYNASFPNTTPFPGAGAWHSAEIPQVFGAYPLVNATDYQVEVSRKMNKAWADFAKDPSKGPGWDQLEDVAMFGGAGESVFQVVDTEEVDGKRCGQYSLIYDAISA